MARPPIVSTEQAVAHLDTATWVAANMWLVRKMIAEFSHERLIEPAAADDDAPGVFTLATDDAAIHYRFRARVLELEHWHIEPGSIEKFEGGQRVTPDALAFIIALRTRLGIDAQTLPVYLEEIGSTLYSAAYKIALGGPSAAVPIRLVWVALPSPSG